MILYHGTCSSALKCIQTGIRFDHNPHPGDFGCGFYLTEDKEQAEAWAIRKAETKNKDSRYTPHTSRRDTPVVIEYELLEDFRTQCRTRFFLGPDDTWKIFVYESRKGINHDDYDIVSGPMADGFRANMISLMTLDQFKERVNVNGKQTVICNETAAKFLSERSFYYVTRTRKDKS